VFQDAHDQFSTETGEPIAFPEPDTIPQDPGKDGQDLPLYGV